MHPLVVMLLGLIGLGIVDGFMESYIQECASKMDPEEIEKMNRETREAIERENKKPKRVNGFLIWF